MFRRRQTETGGRIGAELAEFADPVSQVGKRLIFDLRKAFLGIGLLLKARLDLYRNTIYFALHCQPVNRNPYVLTKHSPAA